MWLVIIEKHGEIVGTQIYNFAFSDLLISKLLLINIKKKWFCATKKRKIADKVMGFSNKVINDWLKLIIKLLMTD